MLSRQCQMACCHTNIGDPSQQVKACRSAAHRRGWLIATAAAAAASCEPAQPAAAAAAALAAPTAGRALHRL